MCMEKHKLIFLVAMKYYTAARSVCESEAEVVVREKEEGRWIFVM